MKNPQAFLPWNGVLNTAMFIVSCLYIAMGFFGYLKFGKDCLGSITLNLPPNLWINDVRKIIIPALWRFHCDIITIECIP